MAVEAAKRPKGVRRFEVLMYASLALAAVSIPFTTWPVPYLLMFTLAVWWSFIIFLVWLTARRCRDWARRILFVLFCLELFKFYFLRDSFPPIPSLIYAVGVMLEAIAYYYVFTGDSREWFRGGKIVF